MRKNVYMDWDNEQAAANIVCQLCEGSATKRDIPGAPPSTHDYDIHLADGTCIALEVTQALGGEVLAMDDALAAQGWTFSDLDSDWMSTLSGSTKTQLSGS